MTAEAQLQIAGPEDIAALYDSHGALAFTVAVRILGDRGRAEDAVQEAFLNVWRTRATYTASRGSLRSWVCRVVRNRAIDSLRRQRGAPPLGLDGIADLAATGVSVEDSVCAADDADRVRAALATLPPHQAAVIELAYYAGHTQTEISTLTGAPIGTVKSRTRLAMRHLAARLTEAAEPSLVA